MIGLGIGGGITSLGSGYTPMDLQEATTGAGNVVLNLALWLKNNTNVTTARWADSSGNDNHATQSTEADQATVTSDGGLDFERSESDHYDLASAITVGVNGGFCLAVVINTESASGGTILSKDANDQFRIVDVNTLRFKSDTTDTTTNFVVAGAFENGSKMLLLLNRSAGAQNIFTLMKNGVVLTPDVDNSGNEARGENPHGFDLKVLGANAGSSEFFDGKILELAFWQRGLTTQEIADVNSYLLSIHGL